MGRGSGAKCLHMLTSVTGKGSTRKKWRSTAVLQPKTLLEPHPGRRGRHRNVHDCSRGVRGLIQKMWKLHTLPARSLCHRVEGVGGILSNNTAPLTKRYYRKEVKASGERMKPAKPCMPNCVLHLT